MKKLLLSILALTLSAGMWAQTQTQKQTVSYLYPVYNTPDDPKSGIKEWKEGSVEATVIATDVILKAGWYVVLGNDVKTRGMTCSGDVHLILADGAKLTTNVVGASTGPGLTVRKGDGSLTIYGQAAQSGQLIAKGTGGNCPGIGGAGKKNGKITINGGIIEATGNSAGNGAAGIGGGGDGGSADDNSGSDITINGGIVTATAAYRGAGIGGGYLGSGSNITINGGTVTAYGGTRGAGIGGGWNAEGFGITINGGTVTAIGKGDSDCAGAGIGGGEGRSGHDITINGGIVIASGCWVDEHKRNSDGIGCGDGGNLTSTNIKVTSTHEVKADNNNPPSTMIENDGSEDLAGKLKGQRYVTITPSLETEKVYAIAAINAKLEEIDNDNIKGIATIAIASINAATSVAEVNAIKTQALSNIASAQGAYYDGKAAGYEDGKAEGLEEGKAEGKAEGLEEGKADAFHGMDPPPLTDCPAVKVTKGDKEVILYAPDAVEMIKVHANK